MTLSAARDAVLFLRHQLPVYSPIPPTAYWHAVRGVSCRAPDPRAPLRERLRREYRAPRVLLCGSGTTALELALHIALRRMESATPVALPSYSCFDVATAAVGADCRVTFYDLDPETLAPDLESFRLALERGARVAVISYLYGIPVDWDALARCALPYGALLIEDAAQGHGGSWRGRPLGSLGPLSVLSFGRGKGWTGGGGGALLVREPELLAVPSPALSASPSPYAERSVLIRTAAQWAIGRPALYGLPRSLPFMGLGETRYRDPAPPVEMAQASAVLLEGGRAAAREEAACRRRTAASLMRELPNGAALRPIRPARGGAPGFLRLPLRLARGLGGFTSPGDAARLGAAAGYPRLLPELPQLRERIEPADESWPGGAALVRELVTLPTHSLVTAAEQRQLLHLLHTYRPAAATAQDAAHDTAPGARALPAPFTPAPRATPLPGDRP